MEASKLSLLDMTRQKKIQIECKSPTGNSHLKAQLQCKQDMRMGVLLEHQEPNMIQVLWTPRWIIMEDPLPGKILLTQHQPGMHLVDTLLLKDLVKIQDSKVTNGALQQRVHIRVPKLIHKDKGMDVRLIRRTQISKTIAQLIQATDNQIIEQQLINTHHLVSKEITLQKLPLLVKICLGQREVDQKVIKIVMWVILPAQTKQLSHQDTTKVELLEQVWILLTDIRIHQPKDMHRLVPMMLPLGLQPLPLMVLYQEAALVLCLQHLTSSSRVM